MHLSTFNYNIAIKDTLKLFKKTIKAKIKFLGDKKYNFEVKA